MPKKSGPRKKRFLAIFSCWMVLYGPKQCCMIRAYRCAALDTLLAYIRKKIDPRPPGVQKCGHSVEKKLIFGPKMQFLARNSFCLDTSYKLFVTMTVRGFFLHLVGQIHLVNKILVRQARSRLNIRICDEAEQKR